MLGTARARPCSRQQSCTCSCQTRGWSWGSDQKGSVFQEDPVLDPSFWEPVPWLWAPSLGSFVGRVVGMGLWGPLCTLGGVATDSGLFSCSIAAVRLADGVTFVVYEFWETEEEWKR